MLSLYCYVKTLTGLSASYFIVNRHDLQHLILTQFSMHNPLHTQHSDMGKVQWQGQLCTELLYGVVLIAHVHSRVLLVLTTEPPNISIAFLSPVKQYNRELTMKVQAKHSLNTTIRVLASHHKNKENRIFPLN